LSSTNDFVLPVAALKSLAETEPSLLRVCGVHDCVALDFRRRAKFRGLPVDELNQLLAAPQYDNPAIPYRRCASVFAIVGAIWVAGGSLLRELNEYAEYRASQRRKRMHEE
jgi:hypothetical protein